MKSTVSITSIVAGGDAVSESPLRESSLQLQPGEVSIRVGAVGICRTDLYVIDGAIPARWPVIPGHEFAGVVESVGTGVTRISPGDRVVVNPVIPCGQCGFCHAGEAEDCQQTRFLGVDLDGACCSVAVVPATAAYLIPESLPFEVAAFAEPVAASLAVLKSGIDSSQSGLIAGENRIAQLTERILRASGFTSLTLCNAQELSEIPDCEFDFSIETMATTEVLRQLVRAIRPRGRIVLKSRQFRPVELTLKELLPKEPLLQAVNYGRFEDAITLLADGTVDVSDLIGERFPLARFADAFAAARQDEDRKTFLVADEDA